mgnify:CR=1 FL=1
MQAAGVCGVHLLGPQRIAFCLLTQHFLALAPVCLPLPPPQAFRASQVLRDAITRLEGELAAARAAVAERDGLIARLTEDSRHVERRVVKELEGAHMSAAEELEALYEKRLAVEADKLRVMAAARDDAQYRAEEALRRLQEQHKLDIKVGEAIKTVERDVNCARAQSAGWGGCDLGTSSKLGKCKGWCAPVRAYDSVNALRHPPCRPHARVGPSRSPRRAAGDCGGAHGDRGGVARGAGSLLRRVREAG